MKKFLTLSVLTFLFVACENNTSENKVSGKIELTKEEIEKTKDNSNAAAGLLVRKAILKEMSEYEYTEEEKKELEEIKTNVEIEYFLNRQGIKSAKVEDTEVLQVYQNNIDKLKDADIVKVMPEIKEKMLIQRAGEEKIKYMNSLVEKYKLNDELKKYFPESEQNQVKEKPEEEKDLKETAKEIIDKKTTKNK